MVIKDSRECPLFGVYVSYFSLSPKFCEFLNFASTIWQVKSMYIPPSHFPKYKNIDPIICIGYKSGKTKTCRHITDWMNHPTLHDTSFLFPNVYEGLD